MLNQRTNGPVNFHLISWPRISIFICKYLGPSFMEIHPLVMEKIFEGFLPYMSMAAILVIVYHVTSIILIYFHFHVPKSFHTKFCLKRPSGF